MVRVTEFEFDTRPSPGTNRTGAVTDCPTCNGDRLVPVDEQESAYMPCPDCHPAAKSRPPVETDSWWKE